MEKKNFFKSIQKDIMLPEVSEKSIFWHNLSWYPALSCINLDSPIRRGVKIILIINEIEEWFVFVSVWRLCVHSAKKQNKKTTNQKKQNNLRLEWNKFSEADLR